MNKLYLVNELDVSNLLLLLFLFLNKKCNLKQDEKKNVETNENTKCKKKEEEGKKGKPKREWENE